MDAPGSFGPVGSDPSLRTMSDDGLTDFVQSSCTSLPMIFTVRFIGSCGALPPVPPAPPAPPIPPVAAPPMPALPLLLELLELDSDPEEEAEELLEALPLVVGLGQPFSASSVHAAAPRTKPPTTRERRTNFCIAAPRNRAPILLCT